MADSDEQVQPQETPEGAVVGGSVHNPDDHVDPDKKEAKPAKPSEGVLPRAAAHANVTHLQVDQSTKRSDDDALTGHMVTITKGDYEGKSGVFLDGVEFDKQGYPSKILVRLNDPASDATHVVVDYKDVRPKPAGTTQ